MLRATRSSTLQTWAAIWLAASAVGCSGPVLAPTDSVAPPTNPSLEAIDADYLQTVKPIFAGSCASCHGAGNRLPWYHSVPLVSGLIDDDIARARRSVDMSHDFPFRGRATPSGFLDAIREVLDEDSMPPLRYRALHWGAGLDADEKDTVRQWIERSQRRLDQRVTPN